MQPKAGLRQFPVEQRRAWAVCAPRAGAGPAGLRHCVHTTVLFVCSIPASPQHDWTSEPKKKVYTTAPLVSGQKSDTEETSKQKLNRGSCLGSDTTLITTPEKIPDVSLLFFRSFFLFVCFVLLMLLFDVFFFSFSSFFNFLKFLSPLFLL